jgi:hypothetical protein
MREKEMMEFEEGFCRRSRCGFDGLEGVSSQTAMMMEGELWLSTVVLGRRGETLEEVHR